MTMRPAPMRAFLLPTCLLACALSASAQERAPGADAPPPPRTQILEEGQDPGITIRKPDNEKQITQTRDRSGRVTEVRVKQGNNEYYLKPNVPAGSALPGDAQSNETRAPQWKIGEFGKVPPQPADEPQTLQPNPAASPTPGAGTQGGSK